MKFCYQLRVRIVEMSQMFFGFDKVLSLIYEETNDPEINPVIYVIKHCELLKNQIDSTINKKDLKGKNVENDYLVLINEINEFQSICVENCRNNMVNFTTRFKYVIEKALEIKDEQKSKDSLEKMFDIRNKSLSLRRDIFNKNLIFLEYTKEQKQYDAQKQENNLFSLVVIEPCCLDDFQIETIK